MLVGDALLRREGGVLRTTRRWQGAMARAAYQLFSLGDGSEDLRVPVAWAVLDLYGDALDDADVARRVEAMVLIEERELDPRKMPHP